MNDTQPRRSSRGDVGSELHDDPRDDWLGDVSDDDWSEGPSPSGRPATSPFRQVSAPGGERLAEPASARSPHADEADAADFARRRVVAAVMLVSLAVLAGVFAFLVLRGSDEPTPTSSVSEPVTSPTSTETTQTTPAETTTTTTPATTPTTTTTQPETGGATSFTLPEGTKLQRDADNDAAVVRELQEALTAAGYNPGAADGTFGEQTEAAVIAFQQANGLAVDGRVGPETAAALNSALAGG